MVKALFIIALSLCVYSCTSTPTVDYKELYSKKEHGSKFLEIDGQMIHYRSFGKGRPVLLLHGICDSLHTWRHWKDGLVQSKFQFISIDLPGYGLTGQWNKSYTTQNYIDLINKFLQKLEIENVSIIGNSLGGYMAWNYALKYPNKVNKLVLISPAGYPLDPPFVVHFGQDKFTRWLATTFSNQFIYKKISESVFYDASKLSQYDNDRFYHLSLIPGNAQAYMDTFNVILKLSKQVPNLKELKTPTLLLWGKEDAWIPYEQTSKWKEDVENLKHISYEKVGHVPQLEIPQRSLKDIISYLQTE
ncbi:alpha/beta fold hydrolase [Halobacteriovorax sp. HLS]|uniref:alpha/beta fold hydrolase n=1 Tax=Halobacteriovorax sp. HLS TaxID=2234000 RepID=UPI000FDBE8B4|nr:alpha/beta hydrolase [Halobacteriovorax sp. HLS]